MSHAKKIFGAGLLVLIAATAVLLMHMKAHQRLGDPGVKTRPMAGTKNLEVLLPVTVPGYKSEILTNAETELLKLPSDTSFRVRAYQADDNSFWSQISVVVMGVDRSSIHKPQICMTGQGWMIDNSLTRVENVRLDRPQAYDLPVNKIVATKTVQGADGKPQTWRGIYVYWYVDATHYTANSWQWMAWWLPRDLLLNGVLERWAYISYFTPCQPGQEEATFSRIKQLIAKTVPEFQTVPQANSVR
ncbi:MAG TPA: exosortase-associated EpsI family protein [Verrucomicrobiae bacterium]|jgi:hypothetical protein